MMENKERYVAMKDSGNPILTACCKQQLTGAVMCIPNVTIVYDGNAYTWDDEMSSIATKSATGLIEKAISIEEWMSYEHPYN